MSNFSSCLMRALVLVPFTLMAAEEADEWDISKLDASKLPAAAEKKDLTYEKDIRPILSESCTNCHGERRQRGKFRLDSLEALLKGGEHGKSVVPGNAEKSSILFAAAGVNDDIAMPPKKSPPGGPGGGGRQGGAGGPGGPGAQGGPGGQRGLGGGAGPGGPPAKPLTQEQVSILRAWIEQGAK